MRVVGFEKRQRDQLAVQKDLKQPVELHNCVIQKQRRGDGMEVVISGSTKISSPRKYEQVAFRKPPEKCTVSQIKDKDDSELTILMIKVLKVSTKQEVKPGLFKEDVMIGDKSGYIKITLWQNDMQKLELGKSYMIEYATIKSFNNVKYLSTPKIGFNVTPIDDIGEVKQLEDDPTNDRVENAIIFGVESIIHHKVCIKCQGNVDDLDGIIGTCCKCGMTQRMDRCTTELSARLFISAGPEAKEYMTAFKINMQKIMQDDTSIEDMTDTDIKTQLLMSDPFSFTFSMNNVIIDIFRDHNLP